VLVDDVAVDVVKAEGDRLARGGDREEASFHAMEAVHLLFAGGAAGVLVARGSTAELLNARRRIDRVILPIARR
jgi:hypothetical protein